MRKFLKRAGLGLLSIILLAAVGLAVWEPLSVTAAKALPKRTYNVEIIRDAFGVPHIKGKTDADAAYGLAYAHAEDDFDTIQEVIAMTRGRAGAMLGVDGAKADFAYHLLGARQTAERDYAKIPADVRAVAEGYAAGLNLYAEKHAGEVRLSSLFPVDGQDIVTGFVLRAPFFFGLDNVISKLADDKPAPNESASPMVDVTSGLTPAGRDPDQNGSNGWAVAPKKMADGKTWLISNSHQPYEGGVAWYEAVTHSEDGLSMAGATFPGAPIILLGHNRNLGWTNTVNRPDLIDVYKLTLNAAGDAYKFDGLWKPLEEKRIWLRVKYGPFTLPVPRTIYRSIHGPVIKNKDGAFAIRYAGIDNTKALEQYYRNTKAQNWEEWTASMRLGGIPATNFLYADKSGRIAYLNYALFPDRKPGYDYTKVLKGDTSANLWTGPVPFDRIPKIIDPASGYVQNANNTPFLTSGPGSEMNPADYSLYLGLERQITNRGLRAVELMSGSGVLTPEALLAIKMDMRYSDKSWEARWIAQILALKTPDGSDLAKAQALLKTWDFTSDGIGTADALAERMIREAAGPQWRREGLPDALESLRIVVADMQQRFKRIDPPLGDIQRLRRGSADLPMLGGHDTLRATSIWDKDQPDGLARVRHGDSFIMLVRWDKGGRVISESIQPYGAATTRPASKHYTDQMQMFVDGKYKPVYFEWADAVANAKRRYKP
jgi:acyl-homoserine-lactone acylase